MNNLIFLMSLVFFMMSCANKNSTPGNSIYLDPSYSIDTRVANLVNRMTLEEKISQMVHNSDSIPRLGIPAYNWWNECLHGVGRAGKATIFPQAIGLAASWDDSLVLKVATAISDEARIKYHHYENEVQGDIYRGLTFWSPNINIFRDPRWGRGQETYGEDPFLTGKIGTAFIKGLQGNDSSYLKTIATIKHYAVHSGPEPDRHVFDATTPEQDLWETYLPAFETCIKEGNVQSIMCAYNRYEGEPCCGSHRLQNEILRKIWGFKGYVVSDCWAIYDIYQNHRVVETPGKAAALSVVSGTDLNCGDTYHSLLEAVNQNLISESEIDTAVTRLFRARFKLGMFDPIESIPWAKIPLSTLGGKENKQLALETAQKSIVLLKNHKNLLPLDNNYNTIAVIGPGANDEKIPMGNYHGLSNEVTTLLEGIKNIVSGNTKVLYARGCDLAEGFPYLEEVPPHALFLDSKEKKNGLYAKYYNQPIPGKKPHATIIDSLIDIKWLENPPINGLNKYNFSVKWTGYLVPPKNGKYAIGGYGQGHYKIYVNNEIIECNTIHEPSKKYVFMELKKGKTYPVHIEYMNQKKEGVFKFVWSVPNENLMKEAIEKAKQADIIILALGLSPELEGEESDLDIPGFKGGDRTSIDLPGVQIELMKNIYKLKKPIVLVLQNGSALSINWADEHIPAILETWYGGQEAGNAIANVLFGKYNPAGRLPVTFYRSIEDLPPFEDYKMSNRTYRYFSKDPLYHFGYGLSYTTFKYNNIRLENNEINNKEHTRLLLEVTNTGEREGEEVIQVYINHLDRKSVFRPVKELKDFKRIELLPGETKTVSFDITPKKLSSYNLEKNMYSMEPGKYKIMVGPHSNNLESLTLTVKQ